MKRRKDDDFFLTEDDGIGDGEGREVMAEGGSRPQGGT